MSAVSRSRIKFAVIFAITATLIVWLLLGETSPFYSYFLSHDTIPQIVSKTLFVPYIILLILRPASFRDQVTYALVFLHWLLVGYIIAILLWRRKEPKVVSILPD